MPEHLNPEEQKWAEVTMDSTKAWLIPSLKTAAYRLDEVLGRYKALITEYTERMAEVRVERSDRIVQLSEARDEFRQLTARVERLVRESYQFQPDEDGEGGVTWSMAFADHDMLLNEAGRDRDELDGVIVELWGRLTKEEIDIMPAESKQRIYPSLDRVLKKVG